MRSAKRILVALSLAAALAPTRARAQGKPGVDAAKAAAIRRLLDLTGAARLSLSGMEAMVPAQRAANPEIPGGLWDAFVAHARRDLNQFVDSMVPIYAARFDQQELEQLVRFYESPLGRHLTAEQPQILQESIQVGQRWGMQIGKAIGDSMRGAGVKPPTPN